jgi:hypothetical protein
MITTKTEITCTTCEPFLSETMKRRKEEIAGSVPLCCSLLPHKRDPVGSHGSIRYNDAGALRRP